MTKILAAIAATFALALGGLALAAAPASADPCSVTTILGTPDRDTLRGTRCNDRIFGFGDRDRLIGARGHDALRGGRGDDRLNGIEAQGPATRDRLNGGRGFDRCVIDAVDVAVRCELIIRR